MFFFFFKQKTAYELRISDWSSDVCSSDLRTRWFAIDSSAASWRTNLLHTGTERGCGARLENSPVSAMAQDQPDVPDAIRRRRRPKGSPTRTCGLDDGSAPARPDTDPIWPLSGRSSGNSRGGFTHL